MGRNSIIYRLKIMNTCRKEHMRYYTSHEDQKIGHLAVEGPTSPKYLR